jgi:hypothetical protein
LNVQAKRIGIVLGLAIAGTGCGLGYSSALGFRARQAVMQDDVPRFQELMEEAATTMPKGPHDNPKKTVLTHFLDLAGDPRFFPYIEGWKQKGWVDEDLICSIHRAHYRAMRDKDPIAAQGSVDICLNTARVAAPHGDRSWQVDDCLDEAAFLTQTATEALVPFLKLAADPKEPLKFRVGLLHGMTNIPIGGAQRKLDNDSKLSRTEAEKSVGEDLEHLTARFTFIVSAVRPYMDGALLAGGTALGAMQIEYASNSVGKSYVATYAASDAPDEADLAWAWVRAMKHKKPIPELAGLGIWNKDRETKDDVFWYFCARPSALAANGALGPMNTIEAISIRTLARSTESDRLRVENCIDKKGADPYPEIRGPYPAESIGRAALIGLAKATVAGTRTTVRLKRRVILGGPTEASPRPEPEKSADSHE